MSGTTSATPEPQKGEQVSHVYHHQDHEYAPSISMNVERNSRGYNWSASVSGCQTVNGAILLLRDAEAKLKKEFGDQTGKPEDAAKAAEKQVEKPA